MLIIIIIIMILYEQRGVTALMLALFDHDEIARLLIDKGANLDIKDEASY